MSSLIPRSWDLERLRQHHNWVEVREQRQPMAIRLHPPADCGGDRHATHAEDRGIDVFTLQKHVGAIKCNLRPLLCSRLLRKRLIEFGIIVGSCRLLYVQAPIVRVCSLIRSSAKINTGRKVCSSHWYCPFTVRRQKKLAAAR